MNDIHSSLLPTGLKDLLSPEAETEAWLINQLIEQFQQFGYRRVKPPLVEFEESLLAPGPGAALSRETFRLMDPISGRMMGVRADVTAQIARLAGSRLANEERPLRLSYAADVLQVNGTALRPERQFCQVGCELIGAQSIHDDVESCLSALKSLDYIGISNLSIDLALPTFLPDLYRFYDLKQTDIETADALLKRRDRDGIATLNMVITPILLALMDASGAGEQAITALNGIEINNNLQDDLHQLTQMYHHLTKALAVYGLSDVQITIDLIERTGMNYKSGVGFTLYSKDVRGILGAGGRYYPSANSTEQACGI